MLHKIDIHIGVQMYRIILAAFVPIPCPRCKELRGLGEFNHYPCACGHGDIHGHRKTFFPKKTPSCVFCGTVRLKDGEFRSCVCIERAFEYLKTKETVHRYLFVYLQLHCHLMFLFFGRPCMLGHMLGDHLQRPSMAYLGWRWRVKDQDRECGCVVHETSTLEEPLCGQAVPAVAIWPTGQ